MAYTPNHPDYAALRARIDARVAAEDARDAEMRRRDRAEKIEFAVMMVLAGLMGASPMLPYLLPL